jgi:hypothetical protein
MKFLMRKKRLIENKLEYRKENLKSKDLYRKEKISLKMMMNLYSKMKSLTILQ